MSLLASCIIKREQFKSKNGGNTLFTNISIHFWIISEFYNIFLFHLLLITVQAIIILSQITFLFYSSEPDKYLQVIKMDSSDYRLYPQF